jgi:hypothetical protein
MGTGLQDFQQDVLFPPAKSCNPVFAKQSNSRVDMIEGELFLADARPSNTLS